MNQRGPAGEKLHILALVLKGDKAKESSWVAYVIDVNSEKTQSSGTTLIALLLGRWTETSGVSVVSLPATGHLT